VSLTRHCRALDCPRRVPDRVLFCQVHWRQLPPKYVQPIARNIEAPKGGTINDSQKVIGGTRAAVAYLAKKETKSGELKVVQSAAAPVTGRTSDGSSGVPGSGSTEPTGSGRLTRSGGFQN
jgi:hypothetical protein